MYGLGCGPGDAPAAGTGAPVGGANHRSGDVRTPPVVAAPAAAPTVPVQIFVDTSGSMAGFFGPIAPRDPGKRLLAVHEELDAALTETGLKPARKCTVGNDVTCARVPTAPAQLASQDLYRESTSRLDKVLARALPPARIDPNIPPPPDLLDDATVTLLLTDGMAVAPPGGGSTVCGSGADPACVGALLQQRIDEGFGAWIVGLLLPFHGTHYPERTLTAAYLEQARGHVGQLKFDQRNLGVTFSIGDLGVDASSGGTSTYRYQGYKPLLLFVLSRETEVARALVSTIVQKLRAAPIQPGKMSPADTVHSVELAPLTATAVQAPRIESVSKLEQQQIFGPKFDQAQLLELKLKESARFGGGLSQKVWCGASGRSLLDISYDLGRRTLPAYLQERVRLVPDGRAPASSVAPPTDAGPRRVRTGIQCSALPVRPDNTLTFTLQSELSLDPAELDKQWWSRNGWSSASSWQMPERVYLLEDIILPILKARAKQPARWDRVVFHVERV